MYGYHFFGNSINALHSKRTDALFDFRHCCEKYGRFAALRSAHGVADGAVPLNMPRPSARKKHIEMHLVGAMRKYMGERMEKMFGAPINVPF